MRSFRRALEIRVRDLGGRHPATLRTRLNLGAALLRAGAAEEAAAEFRAVLAEEADGEIRAAAEAGLRAARDGDR